MVKGAWARLLVGTGKTRAVLHDAKERAAVGEDLADAQRSLAVSWVPYPCMNSLRGRCTLCWRAR